MRTLRTLVVAGSAIALLVGVPGVETAASARSAPPPGTVQAFFDHGPYDTSPYGCVGGGMEQNFWAPQPGPPAAAVEMWGGDGADGGTAHGGAGSFATGTIAVTPGEFLKVENACHGEDAPPAATGGGAGGFGLGNGGGGGAAGANGNGGGGGGGASAVKRGATVLMAAAGGGGYGAGAGGGAGGDGDHAGATAGSVTGGRAGTVGAAGAGGSPGGGAGTGAVGGTGGSTGGSPLGGGGGGGGRTGGGGGGSGDQGTTTGAGGGGGASAVDGHGVAYTPGGTGHASTHSGDTHDGFVEFFSVRPVTSSAYWHNWDIARGVAPAYDGTAYGAAGGYVVDGFGGVHPFALGGTALPAKPTGVAYWNGRDIVRGIATLPNGNGGVTLDGFGGLHAFAINGHSPGSITATAYWNGWDIARGVSILPDSSGGYVVDGYGGMHPFAFGSHALPPMPTGTPYWRGWDIVRGVSATYQHGSTVGGFVLDAWGAPHPFGRLTVQDAGGPLRSYPVPAPLATPYWRGWDIARGMTTFSLGFGGLIVDGWGGLHAFASTGFFQRT